MLYEAFVLTATTIEFSIKALQDASNNPNLTWFSCSFVKIRAHNAGVKVRATKPEKRILDAIVIEN